MELYRRKPCLQLFANKTAVTLIGAIKTRSVLTVFSLYTKSGRINKGDNKQTMKALTISDNDISLKQAIDYICTTKSEQ